MIGPLPPELGGLTAGGVATHTAELVFALEELGVDVRMLATNARATPRLTRPRHVTAQRPTGGWLGLLRRALASRNGARSAVRLGCKVAGYARLPAAWRAGRRELLDQMLGYRAFLRASCPDVVHVQHPLERHLIVRLLAELDGLRLPVVITFHGLFGEHSEDVIYGMMQPNLHFGDRFIAVSDHVREEAVQLGVDPTRVRVIRSGVDTSRFSPRPAVDARRALALPPGAPLVLFVGNLEPRKALDRLIAAMAQVRETYATAWLAIVGNGASTGHLEDERRLRALSADLGMADAVQFVGRVSAGDLVRWYNAADVFVLPSLSEAQGIVALEAMSCARPVVASAVGGLLDTITDGHDGCLTPPGDSVVLAERVLHLLRDPGAASRMGEAARRTVEARFSWAITAEATAAVYRELAPVR